MASPINGRRLGSPLILVIVVQILLIVKSFLEKGVQRGKLGRKSADDWEEREILGRGERESADYAKCPAKYVLTK